MIGPGRKHDPNNRRATWKSVTDYLVFPFKNNNNYGNICEVEFLSELGTAASKYANWYA